MLSKFELNLDHDLDPRIKRTRQSLVDAFMQIIQTQELTDITVQDITREAQVNRATFYAHFQDKYALSHYVTRGMFRHRITEELSDLEQFSLEKLHQLISVVCQFLGQFHKRCHPAETQVRPMFETQIQAELYDIILAWLQGVETQHTSGEITACTLSWAIFGAGLVWAKSPNPLPLEQITNDVYQTLLVGLNGVIKLQPA